MLTTSKEPLLDPHRNVHSRRTQEFLTRAWWKLNDLAAAMYVGAASLIGFEALALILVFTTAWPIAIPIVVGLLALLFFARRFLVRVWCLILPARSGGRNGGSEYDRNRIESENGVSS